LEGNEMKKIPEQAYAAAFRELAVKHVTGGQAIAEIQQAEAE
jgi:hypothetical protein